ncbi:hypothetical protein CCP2SC5_30094 [Azospirillaceae bacterium]
MKKIAIHPDLRRNDSQNYQITNGIIHGAAHVMEQEEIDAYLCNT